MVIRWFVGIVVCGIVIGGAVRIGVPPAAANPVLVTGLVTRPLVVNPAGVPLASSRIVASVELALPTSFISTAAVGSKWPLRIIARNASGATIVGPGPYLGKDGRPLTIVIYNSSPANTTLVPSAFSQPQPSMGASNVATITYLGRSHFHSPTFTVANAGLPASPSGGVLLRYGLDTGEGYPSTFAYVCGQGEFGPPSVGGFFYGGPFWPSTSTYPSAAACREPTAGHPGAVFTISPIPGSVSLGLGADRRVYYAYTPGTNAAGPTRFGYIENLADRKSANISSVGYPMTLGNDGNVWFSGVWHGQGAIGKLTQSESATWHPSIFYVPRADAVLNVQAGIGGTEVLLYHAAGHYYVGRINTDLSGFTTIAQFSTYVPPSSFGQGDLLVGPGGTIYASSGDNNVYRITPAGAISVVCGFSQTVYRLADGTGIAFKTPQTQTEYFRAVHVIPAEDRCSLALMYPLLNLKTYPVQPNSLLGVDSTTPDWIIYSNPDGHRLGVF